MQFFSSFLQPDSREIFKKKVWKKKKIHCHEYKKDLSTPATSVHTNNITPDKVFKDIRLITYFNYNKTGYYVKNYPKPKHNSFTKKKN